MHSQQNIKSHQNVNNCIPDCLASHIRS